MTSGQNSFDTYAFIDSGSKSTLIRTDLSKQLGLTGNLTCLRVTTYDGNEKKVKAVKVKFTLYSRDQSAKFVVNGYSLDELQIASNPTIDETTRQSWAHLNGLNFPHVGVEDVKVLIGADQIAAQHYDEYRMPPPSVHAPWAFKTAFGWCMAGPTGPPTEGRGPVVCARITTEEIHHRNLETLVEKFWETEEKEDKSPSPYMSEEDRRGEEILKSSIKLVDGHFEIAAMWAEEKPELPDNYPMAFKRWRITDRACEKDPELGKEVAKVFEDSLKRNFCRLMTTDEAKRRTNKTNYLCYFPIKKMTSNTTKVRVVFDGAAEYEGTSINKNLLKGPNYLVSLVGVLLRFRQKPVPLCADIEKMYHQVRLAPEDREAFRFLYRPPGATGPPLTYQMLVHVFGAVSSPATCLFAMNRAVEETKAQFPEAERLVKSSFYVDNMLTSFETESEALNGARQVHAALATRGFNLTQWMASSRKLLNELKPFGLAAPTLNIDFDELPTERTLGILWDSNTDSYVFKVLFKVDRSTVPCKSDFLSIISRVYDPLGFVSPVTFLMKRLMQEIWKLDIDWGGDLPEEIVKQLFDWYDGLSTLEGIRLSRGLRSRNIAAVVKLQFRVFTDASSAGFGVVIYQCTKYSDGRVEISFVVSKTRVAPLKQRTIPELELKGACEEVELAKTVVTEIRTTQRRKRRNRFVRRSDRNGTS